MSTTDTKFTPEEPIFRAGEIVEAFDPHERKWRLATLLKFAHYRGFDGWDIQWVDIPARISGGPMPSTGGWNHKIRKPVKTRLQQPDYQNNGNLQFSVGYTGNMGGLECVHLTREEYARRAEEKLGPGTLIEENGIFYWSHAKGQP